jgi:hypothetical protein
MRVNSKIILWMKEVAKFIKTKRSKVMRNKEWKIFILMYIFVVTRHSPNTKRSRVWLRYQSRLSLIMNPLFISKIHLHIDGFIRFHDPENSSVKLYEISLSLRNQTSLSEIIRFKSFDLWLYHKQTHELFFFWHNTPFSLENNQPISIEWRYSSLLSESDWLSSTSSFASLSSFEFWQKQVENIIKHKSLRWTHIEFKQKENELMLLLKTV